MNNNMSSLPGFVGYGIRGEKGISGKNGGSYYYTPYSIQTSTSVDINELNTEFLDKLKNNFKINSINSFEKLPNDREYAVNDIICDSSGSLYKYDGDAKISKITYNKGEATVDAKLSIKSIFNFSNNFYNKGGYNRVINNKNISLDSVSTKSRISYSKFNTIYDNQLADFNKNIITTNSNNYKIPLKIYKNSNSKLAIFLDNENGINNIQTNSELFFDVGRMNLPSDTNIDNQELYIGVCETSVLNRFKPEFINTDSFRVSSVNNNYYTISFKPELLFNKYGTFDGLHVENLSMDVFTIYGDYKSNPSQVQTTVIRGINILDAEDFKRIRIKKSTDMPMYLYIRVTDNKSGLYITSQITKKSINKL